MRKILNIFIGSVLAIIVLGLALGYFMTKMITIHSLIPLERLIAPTILLTCIIGFFIPAASPRNQLFGGMILGSVLLILVAVFMLNNSAG